MFLGDELHGKKVEIDQRVPLSKSILWELQREYFMTQGIMSWSDAVPFYITSNPFIANTYAQVAIRYIQDIVQSRNFVQNEPFYVIELGTGSGKFSYHAMKRIFELQRELRMKKIRICYVMTDFTDSNIKFWESHPAFQEFIKQGKLDFAIYDLERSQNIHLIKSDKVLDKHSVKNPIIVFGNYIFDTVTSDAFRVEQGELQEVQVTSSCSPDNMKDNKPIDMEKIELSYHYKAVDPRSYYQDTKLNDVLSDYVHNYESANILIPLGGINCLKTLMQISNNRMLVISSDKSYTEIPQNESQRDPSIAFHGSFSLMVNLHAIGEYVRKRGGDYHHQTQRQGIKTSVFVMGDKLKDLVETNAAIEIHVENFGPADYYNIYRKIKVDSASFDLDSVAAGMRMSYWDPRLFQFALDRIVSELPTAPDDVKQTFIEGAEKLIENFYHMPSIEDVYFNVGLLYHTLGNYPKAEHCYLQSSHYFGPQFATIYNVALCQYIQGKLPEALETFKQAKPQEEEKQRMTNEWIERIEKEMKGEKTQKE